MALDAEEYKRRRQQRAQERQARQAQRKRTLVKLAIAGGVLIACGILIFFISRPAPATPPTGTGDTQLQPGQTDVTTAPPETTQATEPPKTVIHLAAAGDLNVNDAVVASGGTDYDYTQTFMDVAHLLSEADVTALNFEGNLYGAPYGSTGSAPQNMVNALSAIGVDIVQLANSYSINKGMAGLSSTIAGIQSAGLEPLGVYASNAAFREGKGYTIRYVQGIKIAFVAFTKGMNGLALPPGNENCVNLLYEDYATTYQDVDTEKISSILEAAEKESPDITVAMLHWGSEFKDTISKTQKEILELCLSKGVDVILGSHSHYVQQMVFDPDAGTFIAYSLGDFLSDAKQPGTEYSVILDLEITKDHEAGTTKVTNYSYTPIFSVAEEGSPVRVVRIQQAMAAYEGNFIARILDDTYGDMKYALERIEARVAGE